MQTGGSSEEKTLGRKLQIARQTAGLTQQELCHRAKLSYSTLAKIERGAIKAPSIFTIQNIAAVLGVSLDTLIGSPTLPSTDLKKTSKSGIKFVYFDINGCLVRFFHRAFTKIAMDTGIAADIVETAFWHYNDEVCTGQLSAKAFNKLFAKRLGIESIDWQPYYLAAVDPIPEMHELIKWAAHNYRVGLMSNIGHGFIDDMMRCNLVPRAEYDTIIDSSEVGVIKPDPKIYKIAQQRAGVEPEQILFIDDSRTNLIPAQKLGWHVMWFNDYDSMESTDRIRQALEPAN